MNTTRLGYYYYETHIRELGFAADGEDVSYEKETSIGLTEGWSVNQMSEPEYKDGEMTVRTSATEDPYVYRSGISIPAGDYDAIEVEMKATGEHRWRTCISSRRTRTDSMPRRSPAFRSNPTGNTINIWWI